MGWWIRLAVFVLVLGLAHKLGPCFAANYVIDVYGPAGVAVDYDYDEVYEVRDLTTCSSDAFWFIPSIPGTCYANTQNCTTAGGLILYANSDKCTGTDVCCYIVQNSTMPTMPTPGLNFTQPGGGGYGGLNCTTPTYNPQNPGAILAPPNCTTPSPPSLPGAGSG